MMTLCAGPRPAFSSRRSSGIASASRPCLVRTHSERCAPARRKRDVSDAPLRSRSPVMPRPCSASAQPQASPLMEQTPWPYCVIFTAVHARSGSAAIRPATTLVLPTLRECPPITIVAIQDQHLPQRHRDTERTILGFSLCLCVSVVVLNFIVCRDYPASPAAPAPPARADIGAAAWLASPRAAPAPGARVFFAAS